MTSTQQSEPTLQPELEAVATAAAERLHAQAGEEPTDTDEYDQRVREAASAAIQAGAPLRSIADAERTGEERARRDLRSDVLRRVARAAKRQRDGDAEYEQAVARAARLGLGHREIAHAAEVTHGTVRAIVARAPTDSGAPPPPRGPSTPSEHNGHDAPQ